MDLKIEEGRVYGARYYTVKPMLVWGQDDANMWSTMEEWSITAFGKTTRSIWADCPHLSERWYMNNSKFWFREPKDLSWFVLRWS